jgi:hypothetical protein
MARRPARAVVLAGEPAHRAFFDAVWLLASFLEVWRIVRR